MQPAEVLSSSTRRIPRREITTTDFVLLSGDLDILEFVHTHRFLRRDQLGVLTGRHPKRLHRRLSKLERSGYLKTIRLPQQKFIYRVGRAGVLALVEQGKADPEISEKRDRSHELSELFLRHEGMIVDIHVKLTLAARGGVVDLTDWREGPSLHDSVIAMDAKGSNKLPVQPDAFFSLRDSRRPDGSNRVNYMLEADRSTMSHARLQEKLRAYWAYIEQGRHEKKYGIKGFRVLTVTLSDLRAKNLAALAASSVPERGRKYFYFVPFDRFAGSTDPVGERLCYSARTAGEFQALIPAPNELQKERPLL